VQARGGGDFLTAERAMGVTRACGLVGDLRASLYGLQELPFAGAGASQPAIAELAAMKRRYGYRRIHVFALPGRAGSVNHKRTYRLYREQGLNGGAGESASASALQSGSCCPRRRFPTRAGSMDYVADGLIDGRKLRALTVVTTFNARVPGDRGRHLAPGQPASLPCSKRLRDLRGLPSSITVDHGPEFEGQVLDAWAVQAQRPARLHPAGQACRQLLHRELQRGRFCAMNALNEHWFMSMQHARSTIEAWRIEYNTERPHSSP